MSNRDLNAPAEPTHPGMYPSLPTSLTRSAFRAEAFSLGWEPLALLLLTPVERVLRPWLTIPPIGRDTELRLIVVSLLWIVLYMLWMLPITLYRRWWLPARCGLKPSLLRELARGVRILAVRSAVVCLLVVGTSAIWLSLGAAPVWAVVTIAALLALLVPRRHRWSDAAPRTRRTAHELQEFAARAGFPEVVVERVESPAAPPCSLDVRDGRSVVSLSSALLEGAPPRVLKAAVAHELAHHEAHDVRRASRLGECAIVLAIVPSLAVLRALVQPDQNEAMLVSALPWALGAYWATLTAAFLVIRVWERRTERQANRRAMDLVDDPADVAAAVAMVSASPPRDAGLLERSLWRLLSSHPDPDTVAADAASRGDSHKSG